LPLKKPKEIPKIPKARKKKAEAALKAIPQKKDDKIEFICKALFRYDKKLKRQFLILSVETIVEFTSFAYELSVEIVKNKRIINLVVMGIKAQTNIIPEIKPAGKDFMFDDLVGEYTVNVLKQDGCINSAVFNYNIYNRTIDLVKEFIPEKQNNRLFCKFEVAENEFTFADK
jgi:hypothetical protein